MEQPCAAPATLPGYAELVCRSNFSFLTGASHPHELVERAQALGYAALAIADEASVSGVVRAHESAKACGLPLIVGARMQLSSPAAAVEAAKKKRAATSDSAAAAADPWLAQLAPQLVLLVQSRRGWGNLVQWITLARRRAPKGSYEAFAADIEGKAPGAPMLAGLPGCFALLLVPPVLDAELPFNALFAQAQWLKTWFGIERSALALPLLRGPHDGLLVELTEQVARLTGLRVVACGDVLMHARSRKPLQDTLTATRLRCTVAEAGFALAPNAEAHLRSRARLASVVGEEHLDWLEATLEVAGSCAFSLDELRYEYPEEIVPAGHTPTSWLRALTEQGLERRFGARPGGTPPEVRATIEHELALIERLKYEPYFLTVADLVQWARAQGILCQGRGSAANSAVCYSLGITEVDPARMSLLFERFISAERNEPPDIDVDFEHQRREEVIQYVYRKYGRHRAALTAVVISYRPRSALRDVGRALGFDLERIDAVAKSQHWFDGKSIQPERLRENGFDPEAPLSRLWCELTTQLIGFPRHLSQHPGGFVIAREDLSRLVPVENAAMAERSVIQWDKDDLDALGLLKVDLLALGMLSAIRRALALVGAKLGRPGPPEAGGFAMQDVPAEDRVTYDMLCRGDSVGTFQVESRAQMSMLPRLRPRSFYDLVIEVAIVRPGPIQGGMVHPYLRRRSGEEPVSYPSEEVRCALERTLGVPIFQEQVMQLAILAADFTPGEADRLRRAMAAWKRKGGLGPFYERLVGRMVAKGYTQEYAQAIFRQIEGFGEYGFPESHAASFALLVYVSAWLKCHHPDAFLAALLNSQPMGFYAPAQLVRDAKEHGVTVLPVDVHRSGWDTQLEVSVGWGGEYLHRRGAEGAEERRGGGGECLHRRGAEGAEERRGEAGEGQGGERADRAGVAARPLQSLQPSAPLCASAVKAVVPHPPRGTLQPVRLGLSRVIGLSEAAALRIVEARAALGGGRFASTEDLARRAALNAHELGLLARADALRSLAGHRHQAAWAVAGIDTRATPLLKATRTHEEAADALAEPGLSETVFADYRATGLSLARHPVALLRGELQAYRVQPASVLASYPHGRLARASGLVTHRQRPETAKGVVFVTLEDETGAVNVIVWPKVAETQRRALLASRLMTVYGVWQREGEVRHLVAQRLVDHSALLEGLATKSRNFR